MGAEFRQRLNSDEYRGANICIQSFIWKPKQTLWIIHFLKRTFGTALNALILSGRKDLNSFNSHGEHAFETIYTKVSPEQMINWIDAVEQVLKLFNGLTESLCISDPLTQKERD